MSFLKSYYTSVSSFLAGEDGENVEESKIPDSVESNLKESKSEGWLKGIYNGAYNQSGELWRAVKTDLTEFATVVSKDAKTVVVKTALGVKNGLVGSEENIEANSAISTENSKFSTYKIKSSINRMLDQVSKALYIPPESDDDDYYYDNNDSSQTIFNRIDTRISNLQRNRKTFETDPDPSEMDSDLGDFNQWKEKLNLDDFQSSIAELVKNNQYIFDHYAALVPSNFTHDEFWSRYFYRVASINSEESRREALKIRISHDEKITNETSPGDWDEGNDICETEETDFCESKNPDNLEVNILESDKNPSQSLIESSLKFTERDDVVFVKHLIESSSASEDNNTEIYHSLDQKEIEDDVGWDDEIDVEVNEEDIELARKISESEVIDTKWDDWS